jgi:AraC-like DNA-binding protein
MHFVQFPFDPPPLFVNAGLTIASPGWAHPRRRLDSYELVLGRRGQVLVDEESDALEIRAGRVLLLAAGRFHGGRAPVDAPASFYWAHFTTPAPPLILSTARAHAILGSPGVAAQRLAAAVFVPQMLDLPDPTAVEVLFRNLLHEQEDPCYTRHRLQLLLHLMLVEITAITLEQFQASSRSSATTGLVYGIVAEIADHLTDPDLSVKSIARRLERNSDYLGREFKALMGTSIGDYILRQRIHLAEQVLRNGSDHMFDVAHGCGFGTVRHFQRQFRRLLGMSPSEYRTQQQAVYITTT